MKHTDMLYWLQSTYRTNIVNGNETYCTSLLWKCSNKANVIVCEYASNLVLANRDGQLTD